MPTFRKGKKKENGADTTEQPPEETKQDGEHSPTIETDAGEAPKEPTSEEPPAAAVKHKKKKFSFNIKKRPSKSYSKDDIHKDSTLVEVEPGKVVAIEKREKHKDGKVRRAQSLILDGDQPEKRKKFWKVHRSKSSKKAKSANTSAVDQDTSSVVTNPDMDEWRMSGLLNNVEKANTVFASSSKNNVSEGTENGKPIDSTAVAASSTPVKATIKEVAGHHHTNGTGDVTDSKPSDGEKDAEKAKTENGKVPESEKFVETAGLDYEYASELHVSFSAKSGSMEPVEEEMIGEDHVEDAECAPNFDGGIFGSSVYPLDKKNKIIARDLSDVIREGQIELDDSVDISGWLVLNLAKEDWIVVQCEKDNDEVVEVRDNSVEAV